MKKTFTFIVIFLALVALLPLEYARAQSITPSVVDTTIPVSETIRADVNAWLAVSAPVAFPYWAITYVGQTDAETGETFVSLVAIDLADPADKTWHIYDDNLIKWMGTVIVHADHSVVVYSDGGYGEPQSSVFKMAAPMFDGGGSNVRFPWESGKTMMYGTRGIHAAGGGGAYAVGFSAVDFLGGTDLGPGVASDKVYAVATGEVDYRCKDDTTTLVRTKSADNNDFYIYAHLLHNETLTVGYTFYQGDYIGSLKYGTFDDGCGWAQQTPAHYHLHFGFKPDDGFFRLENCVLDMSSQEWDCSGKKITTGQFLRHGTNLTTGDDASSFSNTLSFWDHLLTGGAEMWDRFVIANMPDHTANRFLYALYNGISLAVRIAWVLIYSNVNLGYLAAVIYFGMAVKAVMALAEFIVFLFKTWKSLVPVLGS